MRSSRLVQPHPAVLAGPAARHGDDRDAARRPAAGQDAGLVAVAAEHVPPRASRRVSSRTARRRRGVSLPRAIGLEPRRRASARNAAAPSPLGEREKHASGRRGQGPGQAEHLPLGPADRRSRRSGGRSASIIAPVRASARTSGSQAPAQHVATARCSAPDLLEPRLAPASSQSYSAHAPAAARSAMPGRPRSRRMHAISPRAISVGDARRRVRLRPRPRGAAPRRRRGSRRPAGPAARASRIFSREPPPIRSGTTITAPAAEERADVGDVGVQLDAGRGRARCRSVRRVAADEAEPAAGSAAGTAGKISSSSRRTASRFGRQSRLPRNSIWPGLAGRPDRRGSTPCPRRCRRRATCRSPNRRRSAGVLVADGHRPGGVREGPPLELARTSATAGRCTSASARSARSRDTAARSPTRRCGP